MVHSGRDDDEVVAASNREGYRWTNPDPSAYIPLCRSCHKVYAGRPRAQRVFDRRRIAVLADELAGRITSVQADIELRIVQVRLEINLRKRGPAQPEPQRLRSGLMAALTSVRPRCVAGKSR